MQNQTTPAADVSANLIAVPAGDHIEVVAERRADPADKGGRRTHDPVPAVVLAPEADAPMPRLSAKERKAAESRARVAADTQRQIDANKTPAPAPAAPADAPDQNAAKMLDAMRQTEAAQAPAAGQTPPAAPGAAAGQTPPAAPGAAAIGPMRGLRERLKAGAYMKMPNGQPANGDEVATALGNLEPLEVVKALMIAFDHTANIYGHLNVGQQSMNYRNKFRGALKRGELGMGVLREAVEVVLEARPAPAPGQTPAPAEAPPAPQVETTPAADGEPVANPAKVDDPDSSAKRSAASKKANASRTPAERKEVAEKAATTRKARGTQTPRKSQGRG
jgi:hypothetical protein